MSWFSLGAALIGAIAGHHTAKSQAVAASAQNKETMDFNRKEAAKARDWEAAQAAIDRNFNAGQAASAQAFSAKQSQIAMNFEAQQAAIARGFNAQEAQKARSFNQMMSNTAHQREKADLLAAGLNPILAANSGAPVGGMVSASSPMPSASSASGVAASHNTPGAGSPASIGMLNKVYKGNFLGDLVHSAMDGIRLENEMKGAKADLMRAEADRQRAKNDTFRVNIERDEVNAKVELYGSEADLNKWQAMSEQEKVNLIKEQIVSEISRRNNDTRLTDAQIQQCDAMAYQAVKLADSTAALQKTQARLAEEKNPHEIAKLKAEEAEIMKSVNNAHDKLEHEYWSAPEGESRFQFEKGMEFVGKLVGGAGLRVLFGKR